MNIQDYSEQKGSKDLYFWYKARKKLIKLMLKEVCPGPGQKRQILDIGCGTGTELEVLREFGTITALDMDERVLEIIGQKGCQTIKGDVEKIKLEREAYDCVCCFDILEHIKNDSLVLNKINACLKPGGYILITAPAHRFLFSTHDQYTGHVRRYGKKELKEKLINSGFAQLNMGYWNFILFPPIAFLRLIKRLIFLKISKNRNQTTDAKPLNKYLNLFLYRVLDLDNTLIALGLKPLFGLSIFAYAKKK